MKNKLAKIISFIINPIACLFPASLAISFIDHLAGYNRLFWGIFLFLFLGFLPVISLFFGMKKGKISDVDFTKKEERTPYIILLLFFWLIALLLAIYFQGPWLVVVVMSIAIIFSAIVLLINLFWKISNHSLFITAISIFINTLFGWHYLWLFLIIPLVFWARLELKKHTVYQLVAGSLLGLFVYPLMKIFGY